ncbi:MULTISPECIES: hypothetical protein [Aeromonas]|uniref:hypothetical protein n=1 Tax=Aeromonas TaxID=642 RepID=UPI0028DFB2E3|nr:hypothetical protein [Aeromonas caviae]MDX7675664.1 hypothetical protein [Aeromonas caviae]MDX7712189.1 hypothetical protein [Aeromonas caviae]HEA3084661.1 hypothetical protein [Aeromonas dhakensis]
MKRQPVWKKLGLLYSPLKKKRHPKLISHATNPLAVHLYNDVFRVYYSGRDGKNRSSVGAVDIDIVRQIIITDHQEPFFQHGPKGSFYEDGVSIGNCYTVGARRYILFMGWQNPADSHWRGDIGQLTIMQDDSLQLTQTQPLFTADAVDPVSVSYPWVMQTGPAHYDMWYGSTLNWCAENGEMVHVINHAHSGNGIDWEKTGLAVPYRLNYAQAFSRPTVIENDNQYLDMWFSYRCGTGRKYRIGYAHNNGSGWKLDLENSGIDVSESGWDSEMIEYPFVFKHKDRFYMLYNGNGYGQTGFGLAVLCDN